MSILLIEKMKAQRGQEKTCLRSHSMWGVEPGLGSRVQALTTILHWLPNIPPLFDPMTADAQTQSPPFTKAKKGSIIASDWSYDPE